jgi:hypothetical protein
MNEKDINKIVAGISLFASIAGIIVAAWGFYQAFKS